LRYQFPLVIAGWLYLLAILPSISQGQAATPAREAPEFLLEWSTANMQAFSTAWLATTPGKTAQSPAIERYRQTLVRNDVGTLFYLRPWIGIDWNDLATVDDRVTIVLVPAGKTGTDVALWINGPPDSTGIQTCRKAAIAYWENTRYRTSLQRTGNLDVRRFTRPTRNNQPDERFLISTPQGILLTTRATDHQALMASLSNRALKEPAADDNSSAATANFSLKPLSLARQRRTATRSTESRNWALSAERLGAEQINQLQGRMLLAPKEECSVQFEVTCPIVSPLKQAIRLFEMPRGEQLPPAAFTTAHDDTLSTWRWDCRPAMEAFGNLFDEMVEPGEFGEGLFADLLDGLKEDPEGPQVDLRRDLFERLGPRFRSYSQAIDAKTNERQSIYFAECEKQNVEHVRATLERFFRGDRAVTRKTIGDYTCWSVGPGKSLFIAVESKDISSFRAAAIGPEGFFVATDPELLQSALSQPAAPSEDEPTLWSKLQRASEQVIDSEISARVLMNTQRRFSVALNVVYSQSPPYSNWESRLMRWAIYGDDVDGKKLSSRDVPRPADLQGFFLPAWLVFQHSPDKLQLKIGFLDHTTPPRSE
jgi:hypothetical protein